MPGFSIESVGGPSPTTESVRAHRWRVQIPTLRGQDLLEFYAQSCDRPISDSDRITLHHGINEIYMPGKYRWQPVVIKFYDVITSAGRMSDYLYRWWSQATYDIDRHRIVNNSNLKREVFIDLENGRGNAIVRYILYGAWPQKISPSNLDYTSNDVAQVAVTLSYDATKVLDNARLEASELSTSEARIADTLTRDRSGSLSFISLTSGGVTS